MNYNEVYEQEKSRLPNLSESELEIYYENLQNELLKLRVEMRAVEDEIVDRGIKSK